MASKPKKQTSGNSSKKAAANKGGGKWTGLSSEFLDHAPTDTADADKASADNGASGNATQAAIAALKNIQTPSSVSTGAEELGAQAANEDLATAVNNATGGNLDAEGIQQLKAVNEIYQRIMNERNSDKYQRLANKVQNAGNTVTGATSLDQLKAIRAAQTMENPYQDVYDDITKKTKKKSKQIRKITGSEEKGDDLSDAIKKLAAAASIAKKTKQAKKAAAAQALKKAQGVKATDYEA